MTGRFFYHTEPLYQRTFRRHGLHERVVSIRAQQHGSFGPQQNLIQSLTQGLKDTVQRVLNQQQVRDGDRFHMQMSSNRLRNASNAFFITALEWRQDQGRAQALLDNLGRMLNSQEQFEVDDSFNVNVVHVQAPPRGSGKSKPYLPGYQSCVTLRQMKRSLLTVPQDDQGLCCPGAILTAVLALKPAKWRDRQRLAKSRQLKELDKIVHSLLRETGLAAGAWGPEEHTRVMQAPSLKMYRLAVVDGRPPHCIRPRSHFNFHLLC